ncbi:MAG TPA: histidine kinase [Usitatibacter sp.]|nr:histidine kinase [Usitatibacter sp.]
MNGFLFIAQRIVAWILVLVFGLVLWAAAIGAPVWVFLFASLFVLIRVTVGLVSHVRRVRLISGSPDARSFLNRHRRLVEVPFPADEAFTIVEAAIRELPSVDSVESTRDSLQVHARVMRRDPYRVGRLSGKRRQNLVHATVTPTDGSSSVAIVCEPERGPWVDWLVVDHGTNLENIEAVTRAISRRVSERRKEEEARVRETATEKELTEAKLSLLHAQVEPHFLYNTLASAQLLTRSDPVKADRMLGNLISYLRHSLPRTEASLSTLGEEIERARAYLEIMKIRMGERLSLTIQVPEALATVPLPPMMLQTLAENAIKHGLEPLPEGGNVWISARVAGDRASVTIADDGRGFSEDGGGTGIGLRNVRERLRLAYGDAASFSIGANFPRGVAATLTVPVSGPREAAHA